MAEAKKVIKKQKSEDGSLKSAEIKKETPEIQTSETKNQSLETDKSVAKAGKRSEKAIKEVEAKLEKEERKAKIASGEITPSAHVLQKPARSKLERKSKKFQKVAALIESNKNYTLNDAVNLACKTSPVKFDATAEVHIRLGVDPRQADQNLRDTITLPAGTGKTLKVAVFADVDGVTAAKKAGADIAASDEFLQQLEKGEINFDILITTPSSMAKLSKYARLLGPKGLMPNPKSGTVTTDIAKAVTASKAGRLEYRVDSTGIIHAGFGKVSFGPENLLKNINAIIASVKTNKPTSLKGTYFKSVYITSSMGPSIPVDIGEFN